MQKLILLKKKIDTLYPFTFYNVDHNTCTGTIERGKAESTHIRRLSIDESKTLNNIDKFINEL